MAERLLCFNIEELELRLTAALERVDRRIMAAMPKGDKTELFDDVNNKGRADYAHAIVEELRRG